MCSHYLSAHVPCRAPAHVQVILPLAVWGIKALAGELGGSKTKKVVDKVPNAGEAGEGGRAVLFLFLCCVCVCVWAQGAQRR